jgi:hypothetical protein
LTALHNGLHSQESIRSCRGGGTYKQEKKRNSLTCFFLPDLGTIINNTLPQLISGFIVKSGVFLQHWVITTFLSLVPAHFEFRAFI